GGLQLLLLQLVLLDVAVKLQLEPGELFLELARDRLRYLLGIRDPCAARLRTSERLEHDQHVSARRVDLAERRRHDDLQPLRPAIYREWRSSRFRAGAMLDRVIERAVQLQPQFAA